MTVTISSEFICPRLIPAIFIAFKLTCITYPLYLIASSNIPAHNGPFIPTIWLACDGLLGFSLFWLFAVMNSPSRDEPRAAAKLCCYLLPDICLCIIGIIALWGDNNHTQPAALFYLMSISLGFKIVIDSICIMGLLAIACGLK